MSNENVLQPSEIRFFEKQSGYVIYVSFCLSKIRWYPTIGQFGSSVMKLLNLITLSSGLTKYVFGLDDIVSGM